MRPATSHRADFISPVFRAAERQGAVLALQVRCAHPPGRGGAERINRNKQWKRQRTSAPIEVAEAQEGDFDSKSPSRIDAQNIYFCP